MSMFSTEPDTNHELKPSKPKYKFRKTPALQRAKTKSVASAHKGIAPILHEFILVL